jgi:hypothetical protein
MFFHVQCLSLIHLGPNWRWTNSNGDKKEESDEQQLANYKRLLRMFQDKRSAQFSIHQIGK